MLSKVSNVTFIFTFTKIEAHWIITSLFWYQKVHYSLQDTLLKVIIKGSFTDNFYPSQAFFSDEIGNFFSSVMGCFYFGKN